MRSLQCARAGAALLVVYFHAVLELHKIYPWATIDFATFGKCGVDVFFVLSGFIMWRSTSQEPVSAITFYKKRIARIAPLYWLLTAVAVAVSLATPWLLRSTRFGGAHALASFAFVPWPNPASRGGPDLMSPVIVPGWTLNFEMLFYAVFGVGLIGAARGRLLRLGIAFSVLFAVLAVAGPSSQILGFYDPGLILEFLLGIAIAVAAGRGWLLPTTVALPLLLAAIVCLVLLDAYFGWIPRVSASGLPAAGIILTLASLDLRGRWPALRVLTRLGDASFSIYLIHIFVLAGLRMVWDAARIGDGSLGDQAMFIILGLGGSTIAGALAFTFIERPLNRVAHRALGLTTRTGRRGAVSQEPAISAA